MTADEVNQISRALGRVEGELSAVRAALADIKAALAEVGHGQTAISARVESMEDDAQRRLSDLESAMTAAKPIVEELVRWRERGRGADSRGSKSTSRGVGARTWA